MCSLQLVFRHNQIVIQLCFFVLCITSQSPLVVMYGALRCLNVYCSGSTIFHVPVLYTCIGKVLFNNSTKWLLGNFVFQIFRARAEYERQISNTALICTFSLFDSKCHCFSPPTFVRAWSAQNVGIPKKKMLNFPSKQCTGTLLVSCCIPRHNSTSSLPGDLKSLSKMSPSRLELEERSTRARTFNRIFWLLQGLSLSQGWTMVRMERTEEARPQAPTKPWPVG